MGDNVMNLDDYRLPEIGFYIGALTYEQLLENIRLAALVAAPANDAD